MSNSLISTEVNLQGIRIVEPLREIVKDVMVPVSSIEAKKSHLIADTFKEFINSRDFLPQDMKREYELIRERLENMDRQEIDNKVYSGFPKRLVKYDSFSWYRAEVNLSDLGVWPKMGNIDLRICQNNLSDTAEKIQQVKDGKLDLYVPEKVFNKIVSIREKVSFLINRFPLILFQGGEIRGNSYTEWVRSTGDPENYALLERTLYDIDDGNTRAVSYSLAGFRYAPSYIGMKKYIQNNSFSNRY